MLVFLIGFMVGVIFGRITAYILYMEGIMLERNYEDEYDELWSGIVENEDGSLNKDQVKRELSDYSMVLDHCAKAYSTMTNGRISLQNTCFFEVENIFNELYLDRQVAALDMKEFIKTNDLDELKQMIREYFDIKED